MNVWDKMPSCPTCSEEDFHMKCLRPATAGPLFLSAALLLALSTGLAQGQGQGPTPAQSISRNFDSINRRVLEMAQDFPADKYDYRPTKEVRSFGEVIVHVMSGNVYAAKAGRGEQINWDELDPKDYKG